MTGADRDDPVVRSVTAAVYEVPTDQQEADGTLAWSSTTMVLAEVSGGGHTGLGYTYGSAAGKLYPQAGDPDGPRDGFVRRHLVRGAGQLR